MTQRLLMLAPYWPPMGGPGVQRVVKFAKYLPEFGVEPFVVTRKSFEEQDRSLMSEVAAVPYRTSTHIPFQRLGKPNPVPAGAQNAELARRVGFFKTVRDWMQLPDHVISWVPFAVHEAARWSRDVKPDALFTTSPYHSTHLAGARLKRKLNLPWIADFRDPWAGDPYARYPTGLHERANFKMERAVLKSADAVTVISQALADDFRLRHPDIQTPIDLIYNGFDDADFRAGGRPPPGPPWIIRHLGTFYPDRKPDAFLRGVASYFERRPDAREALRIELYGKHHPDVELRIRRLVSELGLDEAVHFHSYVDHDQAVILQKTSHCLLLIPGPWETTIPGKLFEYFAASRPILTVAPRPCGTDEVLERGSPLRVEENAEDVALALGTLHAALAAGRDAELLPSPEHVGRFTRRSAAGRLAELVKRIAC